MTLSRARVIRGALHASVFDVELDDVQTTAAGARRVDAKLVDAHVAAAKMLEQAKAEAAAIVQAARNDARGIADAAAAEARGAAVADVAARFLALRTQEESRAERETEANAALAVVLAERLLQGELAQSPDRIAELARQALSEARGARVTKLHANPLDAATLTRELATLGVAGALVVVDDALARGSLVIETNLGNLDAQLAPQLERLVAALREHLGRH